MTKTSITIAKNEFIATEEAYKLLYAYLKKAWWAFIFRHGAYRENIITLGDVLMAHSGNGKKILTKDIVEKSIKTTGTPKFLEGNAVRDSIARILQMLAAAFKDVIESSRRARRKPWVRRIFFIIVSLGSLALFVPTASVIYQLATISSPAESSTVVTNIGTVIVQDPYRSPDTGLNSNWAYLPPILMILMCVSSFTLAVAHRPKKFISYIFVGAVLLLMAYIIFGVIQSLSYAEKIKYNPPYAQIPAIPKSAKLSYLAACQDRIQYNFSDQPYTTGTIFYRLYDRGYRLEAELENIPSLSYVPSREALCTAYDALRKKYPAENIVLQTYVKGDDGQPMPIDGEVYYGPTATVKLYQSYTNYGFFVKR